jgi:uncharacterized protein (TIGR03790 family)
VLTLLAASHAARAGYSGLNVVVVMNQNSTNSVQLGNEYCAARGVPAQNVFRLTNWFGGAVSWSRADFESRLRGPLLEFIAQRGLSRQAEVVVLSMDIPYRVTDASGQNGTTSALFYGFKADVAPPPGVPASCSLPSSSRNGYAFGELPLRASPADLVATNALLTFMLTGSSLDAARSVMNRGVQSDSTFPTEAIYLTKTSDWARNVRFSEFDEAIFNARILGGHSLVRLDTDFTAFTNTLGLLTGHMALSLRPQEFVPGALADSLTSFGGFLFENTGHTSALAFLQAGAAGSYGTVVEPCNYLEKFPHPLDYFYQARGFCLAEAYYQSVRNPHQGVMVGEPLAAPFARPGAADWNSLTNGSVVDGALLLEAVFQAPPGGAPLNQVDLFVDGLFFETITNIHPPAESVLSAGIGTNVVEYVVPPKAAPWTMAKGLADALNAATNITGVEAFAVGDRIELQVLHPEVSGTEVALTAGSSAREAVLTAAQPSFLDTTATGTLGCSVKGTPNSGDWLRLELTKTDGSSVVIGVTNPPSGGSLGTLAQTLFNKLNGHPALEAADGIYAGDFFTFGNQAEFYLYARSAGWPAARAQAHFTGSTTLTLQPAGVQRLEDNLDDLKPRNHLYVASGRAAVVVSRTLVTTRLSDGYHELTLVAYEGTSVRTQARVSRTVRVQNSDLSAVLSLSPAGPSVSLDTPLSCRVEAKGGSISRIELFSTGGAIGLAEQQTSAAFAVPSRLLGPGLHPFHAVVTDLSGRSFRTETRWLQLVSPFEVSLTGPPWALTWSAVPGQQYEILATPDLALPFTLVGSVAAEQSTARWPISSPVQQSLFYRVRLGQSN